MERYILNERHEAVPCEDLLEWGRWLGEAGDARIVAGTETPNGKVSTVFLGLNHAFHAGPPLLFETMVFGGDMDGEQERYTTWAEAEQGHAAMVKKVSDQE